MKTVFISMIGLEERVLGAFRKSEPVVADEYILFINREFVEDERVKTYEKEIVGKHLVGKSYTIIRSSYYDPFITIREFNKLWIEKRKYYAQGKIKVIFDISTFNRQNLLIMLFLLRQILNIRDIELIYTVPEKVNQEISKGAAGFSNVPFFGGRFDIEKKKLLVLLVGYEIDRPLVLWRELEPSKVILAEGVQPTSEDFYEANRAAIQVIAGYGRPEVVQISANDPDTAKKQLSQLFQRESRNYNIFVSPLNTKLQVVGLYLAWENNQNVQIVIAFPDKFSSWLTSGIKEVRTYQI